LTMVRKKRKTAKEIHKGIRKQLQYLERNFKSIDVLLEKGKTLIPKWQKRLGIILTVFEQQKYMFDNRTHSVENRIVSLSQPHLRPIVRGKIKAPVEFGAKLDISVCNGYVRLEKQSFEAYNEATTLKSVIERFKVRTGKYPERILADKIYRNRDNLTYCKERGIRLSGLALGRPKKNERPDRKQDYKDICERVEVERKFSFAKLNCGLGRIYTRLAETTESVIAISFLVVNLKKVCRDLATLFLHILQAEIDHEKMAFIQ
ncbi:MAG: transposase, partial [Clostridiaceae bacterium]